MPNKKRAIIDAATILFAEKGFKDTSVAELAKSTDSAEGTIFYHFNNKNELFLAILEDVKDGILREFTGYIRDRSFSSGLEMIEEVISFFIFLAGCREQWFRLLHRNYPYEFAANNDRCRAHLESIYNTLVDLFEAAIKKGQQDGSIAELPSRKVSLILFSMVNGLIWLKFHNLYEPSTLYEELLVSCRKILLHQSGEKQGGGC